MKPKVAKVLISDLRKSKFQIAQLMAGKAVGTKYKLLTEDQVKQLKRYGINTISLSKEELSVYGQTVVNHKPKSKKKVDDYPSLFDSVDTPVVVTYKDEDGESSIRFNSEDEADKWIEIQESRKSSGEKFDVVSIEHENKINNNISS